MIFEDVFMLFLHAEETKRRSDALCCCSTRRVIMQRNLCSVITGSALALHCCKAQAKINWKIETH